MTDDREITAARREDDEQEISLRPHTLSEYFGQEKVKHGQVNAVGMPFDVFYSFTHILSFGHNLTIQF